MAKFGTRTLNIAGNDEVFVMKSNELAILEDEMGIGVLFLLNNKKNIGFRLARSMLYAGLIRSRQKAKEPWTPQHAGELLDTHTDKHGGSFMDVYMVGADCISDHFPKDKEDDDGSEEVAEGNENPPQEGKSPSTPKDE